MDNKIKEVIKNSNLAYAPKDLVVLLKAYMFLDEIKNMVLFGGTHKTFPGPASGIIMTNDEKIASKIDKNIFYHFI